MTKTPPTNKNSISLEWDLNCTKDEAIDILKKNLTSTRFTTKTVRGRITDGKFKIWTKTFGMRGRSTVVGLGSISNKGNQSHISAELKFIFPFSIINLNTKKIILLVATNVTSFALSLVGNLINDYQILATIFFPIGFISTLITVLAFCKYVGESELLDLKNFLLKNMGSYRI